MRVLFFDTETTGFPQSNKPIEVQPCIVQLAAILANMDGLEYAQMNVICAATQIPEDVSKIHGITTEIANEWGIKEKSATGMLLALASQADLVVGHHVNFDKKMVSLAIERHALPEALVGKFLTMPSFCTADKSRSIVNLPPTEKMLKSGINTPKQPKLIEAYRHFFGEELEGAHDAMIDVRGCARVFYHLQTLGVCP